MIIERLTVDTDERDLTAWRVRLDQLRAQLNRTAWVLDECARGDNPKYADLTDAQYDGLIAQLENIAERIEALEELMPEEHYR